MTDERRARADPDVARPPKLVGANRIAPLESGRAGRLVDRYFREPEVLRWNSPGYKVELLCRRVNFHLERLDPDRDAGAREPNDCRPGRCYRKTRPERAGCRSAQTPLRSRPPVPARTRDQHEKPCGTSLNAFANLLAKV